MGRYFIDQPYFMVYFINYRTGIIGLAGSFGLMRETFYPKLFLVLPSNCLLYVLLYLDIIEACLLNACSYHRTVKFSHAIA